MQKNLLYLLVLLLLLGCNKNEPEPEINCFPQTYSYLNQHGYRESERFVYNERMQLVSLEDIDRGITKNRFSYNEDGTLKSNQEPHYPEGVYRTVLYFYDSKKRLIKADEFMGEPSEKGPANYYIFTYSPDNSFIRKQKFSRTSTGEFHLFENSLHTYISEKQMKLDYSYSLASGEGHAFEFLYNFDDQKSPFWSLPAYRTMMMVYSFVLSHKNNVKSYTVLPEEKNKQYHFTNEMVFNSEGFPVTQYRTYNYTVRKQSEVTYTCK